MYMTYDIKIDLPASSLAVVNTLKKAGYECFLVGGSVRDYLIGKIPHDYDFTTDATTEEMKHVFDASGLRWLPTGEKHGTLTAVVDDDTYEVTTYRIDGDYSDGRHPDEVMFTNKIEDDLSRRDFTVNALAYSDETGVIDCFGGFDDLKRGIIRCVGNANVRFSEDALRILRAIRFSAKLSFNIESETSKAIHDCLPLLSNVSTERITAEISSLMCAENSEHLISLLREYKDVLFTVIPELKAEDGCDQPSIYHMYDVFEHTLVVVKNVPATLTLRLAALFHDIGKPSCVTYDEEGRWHTYHHDKVGAEMTYDTLVRMRFPKEIGEYVSKLVLLHHNAIGETKRSVHRYIVACETRECFEDEMTLRRADVLGHSPLAYDSKRSGLSHIDRIINIAEEIFAEDAVFGIKNLDISGYDLMDAGWVAGPNLGKC